MLESEQNIRRGALDKHSHAPLHAVTARFLQGDADYIAIRLSMVIIFAWFIPNGIFMLSHS